MYNSKKLQKSERGCLLVIVSSEVVVVVQSNSWQRLRISFVHRFAQFSPVQGRSIVACMSLIVRCYVCEGGQEGQYH